MIAGLDKMVDADSIVIKLSCRKDKRCQAAEEIDFDFTSRV